jgi:hypothetical protein
MFGRIRQRFRQPTPSFVVAVVALFFALGGTAGAITAAAVPLAKRALVADNAKKLEGKTSAQLLATAAKAADRTAAAAAQAPGPASSAAGLVSVKSAPWSLGPNTSAEFTAQCDSGQKAISGGWEDPAGWGHSWDSRPSPDGGGWRTFVTVGSNAPGSQSGTVYAVCLK